MASSLTRMSAAPNARCQLLPGAAAQRRLLAVSCTPLFGCAMPGALRFALGFFLRAPHAATCAWTGALARQETPGDRDAPPLRRRVRGLGWWAAPAGAGHQGE